VIDAATNTTLTTINVGPAANGLAWSPDGGLLYVSSRDAATVVAVNTQTNTITHSYSVGGSPQRLAVAPDGSELYVANEASGLDVVNLTSGVVSSVSLGTAGYGLGITPDGTQIYLALPLTGEVRILDRVTRALVRTLAIGGTPRNIAFTRLGEVALVTNEQAVVFIR
jgi:YVTN family beta-propeller protein